MQKRSQANYAAIQAQQHSLRSRLGFIVLVLAVGLGVSWFGVGHVLLALRSIFDWTDINLLLRWSGLLLLVLIPTAGIYSLVTQFAFWEGWLDGLPDPTALFPDSPPISEHRCFVVYLDGIHQLERDHPPRVSAFLGLLDEQLNPATRLVKGLEAYTVLPVALAQDIGSAWFWRRLFALQEDHPNGWIQLIAAVLVQANNVIKVGISSDHRYGPIMNYELSLKIALRLGEVGFRPDQGQRVVLVGYSGGAEMAMGVADYLRRICRAPVSIVSFCGVFSGNQLLNQLSKITMIIGSRDPVAAFGRIAYPGRSPLLPLSNWNRALKHSCIERREIKGMNHNGLQGPFAELHREAVVEQIVQAIESEDAGALG